MSSEPSLLQMPDIVLTEIVKKCDYPSIQSLRKVCRDLRNIVEDVNPEFHFTDVYIMHTLYLILTFNNTECIIYPEGKRVSICYKNNGLNCIVFMLKPIWNEPDPLVNTNSIDRFCADFAIAMSSEKSIIQKLAVNLSTPEDESICNDHAYLVKSLKSKISLLKVQKLELSLRKNSHIIDFLQLLDPNYLQTIQITSFSEEEPLADIDRISKLEQFKKAKELVVHLHFITTPFEYFSHFEKVTVWYRTVTMDMLRSLAQMIFTSSNLQSFTFYSLNCDREFIISCFGPPINPLSSKWVLMLSGSEDVITVENFMGYFTFAKKKKN